VEKIYDIIIIGSGPAGLTSAIYSKRAGLDVVVFEKDGIGGQVALTTDIRNYPGYKCIDGFILMQNMQEQVQELNVEIKFNEIRHIIKENGLFTVKTSSKEYFAKTVVLALGSKPRNLGLKEEKQYLGKGVGYCAICDGAFYKNKTVAVVGGGNSAFQDAIYLSNLAQKVYLIHRRHDFKAQEILINTLKGKNNVEYVLDSQVIELKGEKKLESAIIKNVENGITKELKLDGLFVAVGHMADTDLVDGLIKLDKSGFIEVNCDYETNLENLYAVGDCIDKKLRQIVTACADGAIVATNINVKLKTIAKKNS